MSSSTRLLIPICSRKRGKARQVDGAVDQIAHPIEVLPAQIRAR
jgi:hypothetical protein